MRVAMIDPGAIAPFHDDALCRALAAEGCEVELITAPFAYHPWPAAAGYVRQEPFAAGAGEGGTGQRTLRRLRRAFAYPLAWRRLESELERRRPEIVHLQWSLLPAVERRSLGRLRAAGVAVVQTVHNARPRAGERTGLPVGATLAPQADAWVALCEATAAALRADHPALADRVRHIPPGIDRPGCDGSADPGSRAEARARLGLEAEGPLALFLGLIRPYKGLDVLLEAFARLQRDLPAARLVIAGRAASSFRPYARQIERLRLGERVHTDLRYLPQSVMADYLTAADLVVLPYRAASQSAVLGAALACDRPVVASAVGGLPEMLPESADAMLVPAGDVPALARAIGDLLAAPARAAELGRRAGDAARQRFRWAGAAAATVELYRELVAARAAARPA
ncbi:MAG: glycosyltransferase family 4 protein [Thermoanaerobaculia bacterium]